MFTLKLDSRQATIRRWLLTLTAVNLALTAGTALFIHEWARLDHYGPRGRAFITYVLVQTHLATENVVAAWYSSMLLLGVAVAALAAFAVDRRCERGKRERRLSAGWLFFAAAFVVLSLDEIGSYHERIGMLVALNPHHTSALGWVYVLAIPIALVGLFMMAFAWFHLRRVPVSFWLMAAGVVLFLSDPMLEQAEMAILRTGAAPGSFAMSVHNALLIFEEGVVELFGTLSFLAAILVYIRRTAGTDVVEWQVDRRVAASVALIVAALFAVAVPVARWTVAVLPPGDTGIPANWFPAAALAACALVAVAVQGRRAKPAAALCLALSAYFGAGLYGYTSWLARSHAAEAAAVGAALAAIPLVTRSSTFDLVA
ncbi:MAG: hypothetical protein DMF86_10560 [Acidobacteria bacterium]|nr:MAG: hypothetical protein DMF86_10560 [Acidobacteriota bacterium]